MELIPVILSGGVGSRLWPVSRELHPKPFMVMEDGESLLQKTFIRASTVPEVAEIMTVTNSDLYFKTEDEYSSVNSKKLVTSFILEPIGRNTAPAIAVAALSVEKKYGHDAQLLILSADHLIENTEAFQEAVSKAKSLAELGYLVTFGIQPTFPETGYGYIEVSRSDQSFSALDKDCLRVERFVEKPDLEKAQEYLSQGNYLWNSGMFCASVGTILDQLKTFSPDVIEAAEKSFENAAVKIGDNSQDIRLNLDLFSEAPNISVDYALMEKSDKVAVVSCDIGWSDIGSWSAVSDLKPCDENSNSVVGEVLLHDVNNCYIQNEGRLIGAVGVNDLIIVDTQDALLVTDKSRSQDVKQIVSALRSKGNDQHRVHQKVYRPWGSYTVLEEGKHFKIKKLIVKPGGRLSLQLHHHRSEHWIVINGVAQVTNDDKQFLLNKNESTYILAGHKHRLENPGIVDLVMIEVQSGEYVDEEDIVRFDDIYGRS